MTQWIITIFVGLIAGALGKLIMPGKDPGGIFITILLGIAGAVIGKFLGGMLGIANAAGKTFDLPSILLSVAGVVILLLIYRLIKKK